MVARNQFTRWNINPEGRKDYAEIHVGNGRRYCGTIHKVTAEHAGLAEHAGKWVVHLDPLDRYATDADMDLEVEQYVHTVADDGTLIFNSRNVAANAAVVLGHARFRDLPLRPEDPLKHTYPPTLHKEKTLELLVSVVEFWGGWAFDVMEEDRLRLEQGQ